MAILLLQNSQVVMYMLNEENSIMAILLQLYILKLSCICWHAGIKIVQQVMQKDVFRSQVTQSQKSCHF